MYCGQSLVLIVNFCRRYRVNIVKYGKFSNSRADNSDSSGPISSIIKLIRALLVIYILTKFSDDWLILVDARVLTSKLWTDGRRTDGQRRTVSDHNSSLSTPCSSELNTDVLPNTPSLQFVYFYLLDRHTFVYPYRKFMKIDSSRTISPDIQIACCQKAREAVNRYRDV